MKRFCFALATVILSLLASTGATAQHNTGYINHPKIGYINMDDLIAVMPDTKHAQQVLQACADSLSRVDANLQREFDARRDAFFKDSARMDTTKKEAQRRVLQNLLTQYNQFRADAKVELDSTQQAMTVAVVAKAQSAITAAAKANGYAYVFRKADNRGEFVLVGPQGEDILPLVKKQLGLSAQ